MKPSELLKWRSRHKYTQSELAHVLGVTKTTIYRWEKSKREIPSFLHLTLEYLEKKRGKIKVRDKKKGEI